MDLSQAILDKDGKQLKARVNSLDEKGENEIIVKEFNFKDTLIQAILKEEEEKTEDEISKRYDLFLKIRDTEQVDFTKAEKELLKKLLMEKFDTLVCGQIFKHLI